MIKYLRHMIVFSHVVEAGGVNGAAVRLNISKSVVSQQLKALEQELGVSLLNRNTRSHALTTAGQAFYQRCQHINEIANQAWGSARDNQHLVLGAIRISAPNALIEPIVAPALAKIVRENEGIRPTLLGNDCRVNLIEDKVDLAIRVGEMPSSEYKQRKLGDFRDILCASPSYLVKHDITQSNLAKQNGKTIDVHYVANSWQGMHIKHHLTHKKSKKTIKLTFKPTRLCNSLPAVVCMVKADCGLAYIPDFVFNKYKQTNELTEVMPDYLCETASIYAVHAYAGSPPAVVKLVIEEIKNTISENIH